MISIVIIAAGASSRMGEPKQLLPWGNTTVLGHALNQAVGSKADSVYVALGANFEKIASTLTPTRARILNNVDWQKGMGNTIAYSIKALSDSIDNTTSANTSTFIKPLPAASANNAAIIMLADQPQVTTAFLNQLIDTYHGQKKRIVATNYVDAGVGVPAIFDQFYFAELMSLSGDTGAKRLIAQNHSDVVAVSPPSQLIDIDTRETYLSMRQGK